MHWTKVTGKNAGRGEYLDGFGKQAEMMRTWHDAAGRSRCGQRRQEKLDRRQSTAMYGGSAVMWSAQIVGGFWSRDPRPGGVRRPDTSVPFHGQPGWTGSAQEFQTMKLIVLWYSFVRVYSAKYVYLYISATIWWLNVWIGSLWRRSSDAYIFAGVSDLTHPIPFQNPDYAYIFLCT